MEPPPTGVDENVLIIARRVRALQLRHKLHQKSLFRVKIDIVVKSGASVSAHGHSGAASADACASGRTRRNNATIPASPVGLYETDHSLFRSRSIRRIGPAQFRSAKRSAGPRSVVLEIGAARGRSAAARSAAGLFCPKPACLEAGVPRGRRAPRPMFR